MHHCQNPLSCFSVTDFSKNTLRAGVCLNACSPDLLYQLSAPRLGNQFLGVINLFDDRRLAQILNQTQAFSNIQTKLIPVTAAVQSFNKLDSFILSACDLHQNSSLSKYPDKHSLPG